MHRMFSFSQGPTYRKERRLTKEGSFASHVWETADGRWFDRGGMPIDKPSNLDVRKKEEEENHE